MSQPIDTSSGGNVSKTTGKRLLARLTRRLLGRNADRSAKQVTANLSAAPPEIEWRAVLTGEQEKACPVAVFRELSEELRLAGDFTGADRICERGIELYPENLWLALIHAKIADGLEDPVLKLSRWQRAIELGGDKAPVKAFKNLADSHLAQGNLQAAEAVVRQGMALFPEDPFMEERLARISFAAGFTARAIAQWTTTIERHPEANCAGMYRRICEAYHAEGMLERAEAVLDEALQKYPDHELLEESRAKLKALRPTAPVTPEAPQEDFTAHLFSDRTAPFGKGRISLPVQLDSSEANRHISAMLDFAECINPLRDASHANGVDVFGTWGATEGVAHNLAREMAALHRKPLVAIEFGFISSLGLAINQSPQHSIIVCPDSIYFDSTRPSFLETRLNSSEYTLTDEQNNRSAKCIAEIVRHRITKYNHAPLIDLTSRLPANGRKRILLVDQKFGDNSIDKGLAGESSFVRMLEAAQAMPDHEIVVKLHPDAISGGQGSYLGRLIPDPLPPNFTLIDFDVNPYCLFDVVDLVFVCTSQLGFEALMAGIEVHCFGVPFYAGWGLTIDRNVIPRRKRTRTLHEIFHLFYIEHSRYFSPTRGLVDIEGIIEFLVESKTASDSSAVGIVLNHTDSYNSPEVDETTPLDRVLRIVIILPSGRWGATGRYVQTLASALHRLGCHVMVIAEGRTSQVENGILWEPLEFESGRLAKSTREAIVNFSPHIVYENGGQSRAQRAALETLILTDARLAMQSEDDDVQYFESHHGKAAAEALTMIDRPQLSVGEITSFLQANDWRFSLKVFLDPKYDRWVEPILRVLSYHLAGLHTAIWHPFERRLAAEYGMPTLVVPPVAATADFERLPIAPEERARILEHYGIAPDRVVLFIGGAIYALSNEYSIFLEALNQASAKTDHPIALVIASGRSSLPICRIAREHLVPEIHFVDIGKANDEVYMEMLKASDVVCSPGIPDTFNRYRLPSRLVKAMAMGKPILTCRCGFGESLENEVNAFLTEGTEPTDWAHTITSCLNESVRERVGEQGRVFARHHFDCDHVAAALKEKFEALLDSPRHTLADRICQDPAEAAVPGNTYSLPKAGIKLRSRYHSSMQDAIHLVASMSHHLDTVVHIGAGGGAEFDDYCRLGASRVVLVEGSPSEATRLRELENADGSIIVKQAAIYPTRGSHQAFFVKRARPANDDTEEVFMLRPSLLLKKMPGLRLDREESVTTSTIQDVCEGLHLAGRSNLLVLEMRGLEARAVSETPMELLHKFHWIAVCVSDQPLCENAATREQVEATMASTGFEHVGNAPYLPELTHPALFRRKTINH